ncbi:MAG: 7-cyano-7-deazaguanine synthase [Candidatus Aenigmarchaeota archaeon]|nr:7-cyano-7-deazaguanine synthase [Candidatus Aenigmarchaeota archaeon]
MQKIVSLVSGGMDSCTTMAKAAMDGNHIYPLFFNYGQKSAKMEVTAAQNYINELRKRSVNINTLQIVTISMPFLRVALTGTGNITKAADKDFHSMESKKIDWVPARNVIFLTIASSYCEIVKARCITIGAYKEDEMPPYPDSSREFFDSMEISLSRGIYGDKFEIRTPFLHNFKWDMITFSKANGLPVDVTWSCYESGEKHCGACRNCLDRKNAFEKVMAPDVTEYVV